MRPQRLIAGATMVVAACAGAILAAGTVAAGDGAPAMPVTAVRLLDGATACAGLAVSANGQTAYFIDAGRGTVQAIDPFQPERRRDVVAAPPEGLGHPVAIGCLPGDVLAAVWRAGDAWELRTHRLRPGEPADPARPEGRVALGVAAGAGDRVGVAVSRSRDWLAITGLPAPLPPVVRGVFAGAGVRLLPPGEAAPDETRPVAAAVSPADELVLFESVGDGAARVAFLTPSGRPLLRVATGLSGVRSAAFSRRDGRLWVIATESGSGRATGLWRLDAVMRGGGQEVRPVAVAGPADPRAVIDVPGESLVVVEAGDRPTLVRIDLDGEHKP